MVNGVFRVWVRFLVLWCVCSIMCVWWLSRLLSCVVSGVIFLIRFCCGKCICLLLCICLVMWLSLDSGCRLQCIWVISIVNYRVISMVRVSVVCLWNVLIWVLSLLWLVVIIICSGVDMCGNVICCVRVCSGCCSGLVVLQVCVGLVCSVVGVSRVLFYSECDWFSGWFLVFCICQQVLENICWQCLFDSVWCSCRLFCVLFLVSVSIVISLLFRCWFIVVCVECLNIVLSYQVVMVEIRISFSLSVSSRWVCSELLVMVWLIVGIFVCGGCGLVWC